MDRLEGYRVIVTGAGNGIGRDIATRLSAEGARVLVADIDASAAAEHAATLGDGAVSVGVDVSQPDQVAAMVDLAVSMFGGLDVLVNNVGVHHLFAPVFDLPDSELDRMLDVNTKSVLYTARAAAPHLRSSGRGSICSIASVGAVVIRPGASLYATSKAATIALCKSLAIELAPQIRVNCVLPTATPTGLLTSTPGADADQIRQRYERNAQLQPLQRLGTGADIAAAVAYLSSDDASFVTGVALPVDGGRSLGAA